MNTISSHKKISIVNEVKDYFSISLGILSAGLGIKGFLLSSHFIDGGVTGISMLLNNVFGWSLPILVLIINLPFVFLGYKQMGSAFAIKSTIAIAGLSLCLGVVPYPDVTHDKLLTALFGGFFIGVGIGLAMRGSAVLDGTDIAALLISKSSPVLKVSDVILVLNVVIFASAAFFLGIESALYSILTYFAASKTIDFLINGIDEYTGVTIVSAQSERIREAIVKDMGRAVTVYNGKRGYGTGGASDIDTEIIFTVVTRLELGKLKTEVQKRDPNAFIVQHSVNDAHGGIIKKRPLH
jgi:uncharacterized membrane-anchored protein YitT (DUF2179 family)